MEDSDLKESFLYPPLDDVDTKESNSQNVRKGNTDVTSSLHLTGDCGIGSCRSPCLQSMKTMGCFTAVYGLSGIVTSALSVYISSQITTLEKHFNFNSSVSGLLMSCNDIGYFLTCLLLSYLARRVHIPRALGVSTLVYGVSGIVCTIPYFLTRNELLDANTLSLPNTNATSKFPSQMCSRDDTMTNLATTAPFLTTNSSQNVTSCDPLRSRSDTDGFYRVSDHWRTLAIAFIAIGMTIQGAAKSPRASFVSVYIDDNVPKTKSSWYLGIIIGMAILGPATAFILGGVFSSVYVTLEESDMSIRDPRWLGAWWLGFLFFGSVSLVVGFPLFCFPRKLRFKQEIEEAERKRIRESVGENKLLWEIKGFLKTTLRLFRNPMYILQALSTSILMMSIGGAIGFMPKYLEAHFNIPTWRVNIVFGSTQIAAAALGSVLGGFITSRFKLSPYACLRMVVILFIVSVAGDVTGFFIQCQQPVFDHEPQQGSNRSSPCVSDCQCTTDSYFPVCGDDGLNYFSPCHAGCTGVIRGKIFSNCSCLSSPDFSQASGGLCGGSCEHKFWIYVIITVISSLISSMSIMPSFIASVRSVKESEKPMSLGIKSFLAALIGWFPGPIVYGNVIDTACLISRTSSPCSSAPTRGACLLYELAAFRTKFHGLTLGLKSGGLFLVVCALLYATFSSKSVFQPHQDDDDDNVNNKDRNDGRNKTNPISTPSFHNGKSKMYELQGKRV